MSLEVGYWIALGVGVSFLLLSLVLGDALDFLDALDFDLGDGFSITPVLFTAIAAFGIGGLLGLNAFELSEGNSVLAGLGTAVVLGGAAAAFFKMLHKQEAGEGFSTAQLVGARGRCTLTIPLGGTGRVTVQHQGMTRTLSASSSQEISSGDEIEVVEVVGNTLKVVRASGT